MAVGASWGLRYRGNYGASVMEGSVAYVPAPGSGLRRRIAFACLQDCRQSRSIWWCMLAKPWSLTAICLRNSFPTRLLHEPREERLRQRGTVPAGRFAVYGRFARRKFGALGHWGDCSSRDGSRRGSRCFDLGSATRSWLRLRSHPGLHAPTLARSCRPSDPTETSVVARRPVAFHTTA